MNYDIDLLATLLRIITAVGVTPLDLLAFARVIDAQQLAKDAKTTERKALTGMLTMELKEHQLVGQLNQKAVEMLNQL